MNRDNVIEEIEGILIYNNVSFYEAVGILETVKQVLFKVAELREEEKEKELQKEEIYEYFR